MNEKHTCKECGKEYVGGKIDSMFKGGFGICKECAKKIIEAEKQAK